MSQPALSLRSIFFVALASAAILWLSGASATHLGTGGQDLTINLRDPLQTLSVDSVTYENISGAVSPNRAYELSFAGIDISDPSGGLGHAAPSQQVEIANAQTGHIAAPPTSIWQGAGGSASATFIVTAGNPANGLCGTFCSDGLYLLRTSQTHDIVARILVGQVAAPSTSASVSGTLGPNGWFRSEVDVTLACVAANASCSAIDYALDGGALAAYDGPIAIASDGPHHLKAYSIDANGAEGGPLFVGFTIDATPPIVSLRSVSPQPNGFGWHNTSVSLAWGCVDAMSGELTAWNDFDPSFQASSTVATETTTATSSTCTDPTGNIGRTTVPMLIDLTPPLLATHDDITQEATGPSGAIVAYDDVAAADALSGLDTSGCAPVSDSTFSLGSTLVTCAARDLAGNFVSTAFAIRVVDTTPPAIDGHDDIMVEATAPAGAVVRYDAPATHDLVDGEGIATCAPASGSTLPLGTTTITCSSTDAHGNSASTTFDVRVADTTPPAIAPHEDLAIEAPSLAGAIVRFDVPTTSDIVDGAGVATCAPASGSIFALGNTTVTCATRDAAGNAAQSTTFVIRVSFHVIPTLRTDLASYPLVNATRGEIRGVYHLEAGDGSPLAGVNVTVRIVRQVTAVGFTDHEDWTGVTDANGDLVFAPSAAFRLPASYLLLGHADDAAIHADASAKYAVTPT